MGSVYNDRLATPRKTSHADAVSEHKYVQRSQTHSVWAPNTPGPDTEKMPGASYTDTAQPTGVPAGALVQGGDPCTRSKDLSATSIIRTQRKPDLLDRIRSQTKSSHCRHLPPKEQDDTESVTASRTSTSEPAGFVHVSCMCAELPAAWLHTA